MRKPEIRQPKMYDKFRCIGGACTVTCCADWGLISWSETEYDKLMKADKSPELHRKLADAFVLEESPLTGRKIWNIIERKDEETGHKNCPLINEEGLCSIQKELGVKYMSNTCMRFPRISNGSFGVVTRACTGACPEVINILLNDPEAMRLEKRDVDASGYPHNSHDGEGDLIKRPFLKYRSELMEFFYSLVSDESRPPETGMVLGIIAAKKLSELAEYGEKDEIPDEIERLERLLGDEEQIARINAVKPNYDAKLSILVPMFLETTKAYGVQYILGNIADEHGVTDLEKYKRGEQRVSDAVGNRTYFWRNMYLNTLLGLNIDHFGKVRSIYDFWLFYCACCSMIRLTAAAAAMNENDPERFMRDYTAALFRVIEHNLNAASLVTAHLKNAGYTKPAHIAVMLK